MRTDADKFNAQGLSNIFWAAATAGLEKQEIQPPVTSVVGRMRTDADEFKEQEMSNTFWAAAMAEVVQHLLQGTNFGEQGCRRPFARRALHVRVLSEATQE
eukprot:2122302-Amphidinium_carterae.1